MKIAITGASGNLGRASLSFLLENVNASDLVAVVRDKSKLADFDGTGISVKEATYDEPQTLRDAFEGVDTLLHISTSATGALASKQEQNVVVAAKTQGIKKVVYTSTLNPQPNAQFMATHTCLLTEKAIRESGMHYVFFRNSMYMETIPLFIGEGLYNGQIYYPAAHGRISFVSRLDIAEAICKALLQPEGQQAVYNITGEASFTFDDIAALLHQVKNLDAAYTSITDSAFQDELGKFGLPPEEIEFNLSMARSIREGEFAQVDDRLEKLLGRKRRTLIDYLKTV